MYITPEEYASLGYSTVPECDRIQTLKRVCMHIDSLTYNRIRAKGFDNLTDFQKEILREVICQQADFECENEDIINTILSSYGINGVSMSFGSNWNLHIENGVAMKKDVYSLLSQTGLCCRLVGV